MADQQTLFEGAPYAVEPEPAGPLKGDARRRQRQDEAIRGGFHPLGVALRQPIRLHPDAPRDDDRNAPGPRCGSCWYRRSIKGNSRCYPKCVYGVENHTDTTAGAAPRITHGAGTDVRAVWPACVDHSYGDPALSDDAARHVPEPLCERCNYPGCEAGQDCEIRMLRALGFDPQPIDLGLRDDHGEDPDCGWLDDPGMHRWHDEDLPAGRRVETVTVIGGVL
jgi:hypothetical protein